MLVLKILWLFSITLLLGSVVKSQKSEVKVDSYPDSLMTDTERTSNPEVRPEVPTNNKNILKEPVVHEQSDPKLLDSEAAQPDRHSVTQTYTSQKQAGEGSENLDKSIDGKPTNAPSVSVREVPVESTNDEATWSSMNMPSDDEAKETNIYDDVNDESVTLDNPEEDDAVNVDAIIDEVAETTDQPVDFADYEEQNPEPETAVEDQENEEITQEASTPTDETVDDIFNQPNPDLERPEETSDIPESDVLGRWLAEESKKEAMEDSNLESTTGLSTTEGATTLQENGEVDTEAVTSSPTATDQSTLQLEEAAEAEKMEEEYSGVVSADSNDDDKTKQGAAQSDASRHSQAQVAKSKLKENTKLTSDQSESRPFVKSITPESVPEKDETTVESSSDVSATTTFQVEQGSAAKPEKKDPAVSLIDNSQINQASSKNLMPRKTGERKNYQKPLFATSALPESEKEESTVENTKQNTSQNNKSGTIQSDQLKNIPQRKTSEANNQRVRINHPESNIQPQQSQSLDLKTGRKLENTASNLPQSQANFYPVNTGSFESQILKPTEIPFVKDNKNANFNNKNKAAVSINDNYRKTSVELKQPHTDFTNDEIGRSSKLVQASTDHSLPGNEEMVPHFSRMALPDELDSIPSSTSANNIENLASHEPYFYYGDLKTAEGTLYASLNVSMALFINDTQAHTTPNISTEGRHEPEEGYIAFKWYRIGDTYNTSTAFEMQCKHGSCFIDGIQVNVMKRSNPETAAEEITAAKNNLELFTTKIGGVFEDNNTIVLHMGHGILIQLHYVWFSPYEDINELFSSARAYSFKDYYSEIIGGSVGMLLLGVAVLYVVRKWSKGRNHFKPTLA